MATINGSLTVQAQFSQVSATLPGAPTIVVPSKLQIALQGSGTALDQANLKYTRKLTLSATPTVLDLTSLTDTDGNAVNFARVRSLMISIVDSTDGHTVRFGYATTTTNAWTALISNPGQLTIGPSTTINNGIFLATSPNTTGWLVTSSNKLINLDPGSNNVVVNVEILGANV